MGTINVSFNKDGSLNVDDLNAREGESVNWVIDPTLGSITSITQGTAFAGPPQSGRGGWTAQVETSSIGAKTYEITVQPAGNAPAKAKAPKVQVNLSTDETVKA